MSKRTIQNRTKNLLGKRGFPRGLGRRVRFSRLRDCDVIRDAYLNGAGYDELARRFKTSTKTIMLILRGEYVTQRIAAAVEARRAAEKKAVAEAAPAKSASGG